MKTAIIFLMVLVFMNVSNAQDFKVLIADGTLDIPEKADLQPKVAELSAEEIEAVKLEALRTEVEFKTLPQMSSEESNYLKDFELLDVAKGFFISREIQYNAYLYTAWSKKLKRNYQGVMIVRHFKNSSLEPQSRVAAHYVYEFCGDKYISRIADMNRNVLDEIAIFSQPPTKKIICRLVRIIEFSPNGIEKFGAIETYSRENRPNYIPKDKTQKQRVQSPKINAIKLFASDKLSQKLEFYEQKWRNLNDFWALTDKLSDKQTVLPIDSTDYIEIVKPVFPKGLGEK